MVGCHLDGKVAILGSATFYHQPLGAAIFFVAP